MNDLRRRIFFSSAGSNTYTRFVITNSNLNSVRDSEKENKYYSCLTYPFNVRRVKIVEALSFIFHLGRVFHIFFFCTFILNCAILSKLHSYCWFLLTGFKIILSNVDKERISLLAQPDSLLSLSLVAFFFISE